MNRSFKPWILWALILAIFTMGISPACEFIKGDSDFIEICSDDGEQRLVFPGELPDHNTKNVDCAFCFNTAHAHALVLDVPISFVLDLLRADHVTARYELKRRHDPGSSYPRAPPIFS